MRKIAGVASFVLLIGVFTLNGSVWCALPLASQEEAMLRGGCQHVCGSLRSIPTIGCMRMPEAGCCYAVKPGVPYALCDGDAVGDCGTTFQAHTGDCMWWPLDHCEGDPTATTPVCCFNACQGATSGCP